MTEEEIVIAKFKKITLLTLVFMAVQLLGGYYAHSIAIMADAFHLLSDVIAYIVSLMAVWLRMRGPSRRRPFGYEKAQPLGALINVAIIWVVTAELFVQASHRLMRGEMVENPLYMLLTSIFGVGCNLYILKILHEDQHSPHQCSHHHHQHSHCHEHHHHDHKHKDSEISSASLPTVSDLVQDNGNNFSPLEERNSDGELNSSRSQEPNVSGFKQMNGSDSIAVPESSPKSVTDLVDTQVEGIRNINIDAAKLHILTDIMLSVGVLLSAAVIYFFASSEKWTNWQLFDPFCTYLFSFMAIYTTIPITKEAIGLLMDGLDDQPLWDEIHQELTADASVVEVEELRLWSINRGKLCGGIRVRVRGDSERVMDVLRSRGIEGWVEVRRAEGE